MTRKFEFDKRMERGSGDGILDIPHPVILRYRSPVQIIADFENAWGQKPKGVVLPVAVADGLLFDIEGSGLKLSEYRYSLDREPQDIFSIALEFSKLGQDIYLLLDPGLPFVRTDALHVNDIVGDSFPQICIGNRRAQELMGMILGKAMDLLKERMSSLEQIGKPGKIAGIIIDAVDLLPMSSTNNGRLDINCFCESCRQFFNSEQPDLLKNFDTFPNPWNLVLKGNGTGISYIQNLPASISDSEIVGLSRKKAFDLIFEKELKNKDDATLASYARHLQSYMQVRHQQITESIAAIFQEALNGYSTDPSKNPKRIIITEGDYYSWTSGIQLDRLDKSPSVGEVTPCDEIWFNSTSPDMYIEHIPFRSYMWKRSRYFIDALFQVYASASDPVFRSTTAIAKLPKDSIKDLLKQRLQIAIGSGADKGKVALAALPELSNLENKLTRSNRIGFVGVALTQDIGTEIINKLQIVDGLSDREVVGDSQGYKISEILQQMMLMSSSNDGFNE
jgi:hypothetical protein